MPPVIPVDWRSPFRCPRCQAQRGHPYSVLSKPQVAIVVNVRCRACANEWQLERDIAELAPKLDPGAAGGDDGAD